MSDEFSHIGVARKSGRYPWGSGKDPYQSSRDFLAYEEQLRKSGLSEVEVAKSLGMNTRELRSYKSIIKNKVRQEQATEALRLRDKQYSYDAISKKMGIPTTTVRDLLNPVVKERMVILDTTTDVLRDNVDKHKYVDVGRGVESYLGVSDTKLKAAVMKLQEEGYNVYKFQETQVGTGKNTTFKVLTDKGITYRDVFQNKDKIRTIENRSEDGGRSFLGVKDPVRVNAKRVEVVFAEEGGADMDGVIELRRGVKDLDLGNSRYAQVRIAVEGERYLKGMAIYSDGLPDGVDIRFNTNKSRSTTDKLGAMKKMTDDPDNPFGSTIRPQSEYEDRGKKKLSALNVVNEEGHWGDWSNKLSSQMLSKQSPQLAKQQLDLTYQLKKDEFDEIMSLTNPTLKKKLLESFADDVDASAVHLKAAALPRTKQKVILPVKSLAENEVYAPDYNNGEIVALVRHPHGGKFEIPELKVNNRNREARSFLPNDTKDAIGINPKVAEQLSGADFDGDTVLVIPNGNRKIKAESRLRQLKDFDPKQTYKGYEGMKVITDARMQKEMGNISNLITDMTIKGATNNEIASAVKHSMVVIDSVKHELNIKQSEIDNMIPYLKEKYQGRGETGRLRGASTLVSRASSEERVPDRRPSWVSEGGPINPKTGEKNYTPTGETYVDKNGKVVPRQIKSTKMAETKDAYTLSSGSRVESIYADHANKLKGLANESRKAMLKVPKLETNPSAKKLYSSEVTSLDSKLGIALRNAPRERQAQLMANQVFKDKLKSKPDMDNDEKKKVKNQALVEARLRSGAKKEMIDISDREWTAIQEGAVSDRKLKSILDNTDLDKVKERATPRSTTLMTPSKLSRARSLVASGYTTSEIADILGVSTSTLSKSL